MRPVCEEEWAEVALQVLRWRELCPTLGGFAGPPWVHLPRTAFTCGEPGYSAGMNTRTTQRGNLPATIITVLADAAAFIIVLWIVMRLLDANEANQLVDLVENMASWLAGWSRDMFTVSPEWWRVTLNYGIAALVYLFVGHALARIVRRM
jgi:hypothetical protein